MAANGAQTPKYATGDMPLKHEKLASPHFCLKLGAVSIHVMYEAAFLVDPKWIFNEQGLMGNDEAAKAARREHVLPNGVLKAPLGFGAVLVQIDGKNVLLDSGLGEVNTPDVVPPGEDGSRKPQFNLLETMANCVKVKPEQVSMVIHSHLHGDNIGWNVRHPAGGLKKSDSGPKSPATSPLAGQRGSRSMMQRLSSSAGSAAGKVKDILNSPRGGFRRQKSGDDENAPLITFTNASKHVVQRQEWDWPARPTAKTGPQTQAACPWKRDWQVKMEPLEKLNRMWLLDGSRNVTNGINVELTPGHTPGHQVVVIDAGKGQKAYYIGDLLHTTAQITNPEFDSAFDCCQWPDAKAKQFARPEMKQYQASQTRKDILKKIAAEKAYVICPHLPFPGVGKITERRGRFAFQPVGREGRCGCFAMLCCR